jgi:thiol-disulfide isomerase/thioredoxin
MKHYFSWVMLLSAVIGMGAACQQTSNTATQAITNTVVGTNSASADEYRAYDAEQVTQAATTGDAVLFFHAPWCPTCAALDRSIIAGLVDIPEGLTIFKTDYDTSQELKETYGVTYQHTLVQVDADGTMIAKWSGGTTLQSIIDHVE